MLNSDDLTPKICFEISPQHEFTFYGRDGQVVGTMNFSRTPAFEGSLDESAHPFFNGVANLWHNEISDLRAKLQAAEERIVELEEVRDLFKRGADSRLEQINDPSKKLTDSEITSNLQRGFFNAAMDRANKAEASRDKWKRLNAELEAKLQAAEAEVAEWREYNPTPAGLLAERKRADDAEKDNRRIQAEVARLLDVGADAFHEVNTLHAAKDAMETNLIYVTSQMDEHPDGYEGPCWCRVCRSYATDDGEDGK